jgi:hypothetical protein
MAQLSDLHDEVLIELFLLLDNRAFLTIESVRSETRSPVTKVKPSFQGMQTLSRAHYE